MLLVIILEFGAQSPKRIISIHARPAMISFMFIYGFGGLLRFVLFFILLFDRYSIVL